jgi:hypothetical protein
MKKPFVAMVGIKDTFPIWAYCAQNSRLSRNQPHAAIRGSGAAQNSGSSFFFYSILSAALFYTYFLSFWKAPPFISFNPIQS